MPDKKFSNIKTVFRKGTDRTILIHTDQDIGQYNAVIYLSMGNHTVFWKNNFTGFTMYYDDRFADYIHRMEADDPDKWKLMGGTLGDFNSVAIYPSNYFHSIYPFENKDDRLVQVVFFDMENK